MILCYLLVLDAVISLPLILLLLINCDHETEVCPAAELTARC